MCKSGRCRQIPNATFIQSISSNGPRCSAPGAVLAGHRELSGSWALLVEGLRVEHDILPARGAPPSARTPPPPL